jgi:glycosyltransferase involved in cell wall biosynthesis
MTPRISVNLITLNEERNIARCLDSVAWADEVVIVDGGSRDRSVEIATHFTDHVFVHPFDDFASQRNRALDRSRGEWIFSIDADERVPERLGDEILRRSNDAAPACDGFWVPIRSRIFGRRFRYCGTQGERKMRLFRRAAGRWRGGVHETVDLTGEAGQLQHAIEHESTPDLDTYLQKLARYSSMAAARMLSGGERPARWKPWLRPAATFAKMYFVKLGMLDGPEGFRFCALSAWESWITYHKFLELFRAANQPIAPTDLVVAPAKEEWHEPACVAA